MYDVPGGERRRFDALNVRDCRECGRPTVFAKNAHTAVCAACAGQPIARRSPERNCPVDDTVMTPEWRSDVVVERCPSCRGMWLDEGELERIVAATRSAVSDGRGKATDLILNILTQHTPGKP